MLLAARAKRRHLRLARQLNRASHRMEVIAANGAGARWCQSWLLFVCRAMLASRAAGLGYRRGHRSRTEPRRRPRPETRRIRHRRRQPGDTPGDDDRTRRACRAEQRSCLWLRDTRREMNAGAFIGVGWASAILVEGARRERPTGDIPAPPGGSRKARLGVQGTSVDSSSGAGVALRSISTVASFA
jgi:hypothetical protein